MQIITDIPPLEAHWGCAFVPTMGALHDGHRSLIRLAAAQGRPVLVSIFVNPAQFAAHEDLGSYPRTLERDLECAAGDGATAVFVPDVDVVYPQSEPLAAIPLPNVGSEPALEDAFRPHFFAGVCGVVARLFDLVRPSVAVFGEKDWQQLKVIEAMVRSEPPRWGDIQILSGATVREDDGLAMSSRNIYLDEEQRHRALALFRALSVSQGLSVVEAEALMQQELSKSLLEIDYAVVRDAKTLGPVCDGPRRGLIAATLDGIRLIDNMPV